MSVLDGDPRVAAPELFGRLTPWEQRLAGRAFAERVAAVGRNDPECPDDEPAGHVAAVAVRTAAGRAGARSTVGAWLLFGLGVLLAVLGWDSLRGTVLDVVLGAAVLVSVGSLGWARWRRRQVARFLGEVATWRPPSDPSDAGPPAPASPMGPLRLSPQLAERITWLERTVALGFYPGEGRIGTGHPRGDGGDRDRRRWRTCLRVAAALVLLGGGWLGSLLVDAGGSALVGTHDGNLSGAFVVGWLVFTVWFVRRWRQVGRWYRAGVGRESTLASRDADVPPEPVTTARPPSRGAVLLLMGGVAAFLLGVGIWGVAAGLHQRTSTRPFADGVETTGIVTDVQPVGSRGDSYRAVSSFTDRDGATHQVTSPSGGESPSVGDRVRVSYEPGDPGHARELSTNQGAWRLALGIGVLSAVLGCLLAGFTLWAAVRRRGAPGSPGSAAAPGASPR